MALRRKMAKIPELPISTAEPDLAGKIPVRRKSFLEEGE